MEAHANPNTKLLIFYTIGKKGWVFLEPNTIIYKQQVVLESDSQVRVRVQIPSNQASLIP